MSNRKTYYNYGFVCEGQLSPEHKATIKSCINSSASLCKVGLWFVDCGDNTLVYIQAYSTACLSIDYDRIKKEVKCKRSLSIVRGLKNDVVAVCKAQMV